MRKLRPSYKYSKLSNQDLNLDSLEPEPMLLWQGRDIGSAVIYSCEILISQIYTGKYDSYNFCLHGAHNWAVLLSQQGSLCKDKTWLPNNTRWSHISVPKEQSYSHFQLFTSLLFMLLTSLTVSPVSLFQHMVRAPVQAMVNFLPPQTSSRQNPWVIFKAVSTNPDGPLAPVTTLFFWETLHHKRTVTLCLMNWILGQR